MFITNTQRMCIDLTFEDEIAAMREIVRLAHAKLRNSPCIQLHGNPCQRQAGLIGPELFRVKQMLEKLGGALGVDCPYDAAPETSYPVATI